MKTEEKFKVVFLEKVFFRENELYKASVIYFFIKNSRNKHIFLVEKDFEKKSSKKPIFEYCEALKYNKILNLKQFKITISK